MNTETPFYSDTIIVLCTGHSASSAFLGTVKQALCDVAPHLFPGDSFTLKQLFGPDEWIALSDGQRRLAGHCARHLAETGHIPLELATPPLVYPRRYRLR